MTLSQKQMFAALSLSLASGAASAQLAPPPPVDVLGNADAAPAPVEYDTNRDLPMPDRGPAPSQRQEELASFQRQLADVGRDLDAIRRATVRLPAAARADAMDDLVALQRRYRLEHDRLRAVQGARSAGDARADEMRAAMDELRSAVDAYVVRHGLPPVHEDGPRRQR